MYRRPRLRLIVLAALAAAFLVTCKGQTTDECASDDECFKGEICASGSCVATNDPDGSSADGSMREDTGTTKEDTQTSGEEDCKAPGDEDGDGDANCLDSDCAGEICRVATGSKCVDLQCQLGETGDECNDMEDNDNDQRPDCMDPDCQDSCYCKSCKETCGNNRGNGKDEDKDGVTDEGCKCRYAGKTQGICTRAHGQAIIGPDGNCEPPPGYEPDEITCDTLDNDCDGVVDEGCNCKHLMKADGVCAQAVRDDRNQCPPPPNYESNERSCDGLDNDCDGQADELNCKECNYDSNPKGVCGHAKPDMNGNCNNPPSRYSGMETTCDRFDNDCDGIKDENCPCDFNNTNIGVCANGSVDPNNGKCNQPMHYEGTESTCDGRDNDCDGKTDENGCKTCRYNGTATGVCRFGQPGSSDSDCNKPSAYERDESSCDTLDNDCDGAIDEGCSCYYRHATRGVCADATRNAKGICEKPSTYEMGESTCGDKKDNDCDGLIDGDDGDCST